MCKCNDPATRPSANGVTGPVVTTSTPIVQPAAPLAHAVNVVSDQGAPDSNPAVGPDPGGLTPIPPFRLCHLDFRDGCYVITMRPPIAAFPVLEGTLRVDRAAPDGGPDNIIVSGDLYTQPLVADPAISPVTVPATGPVTPPVTSPGGAPNDAALRRRAREHRSAQPATNEALSVAGAASTASAITQLPILVRPRIPIFARSRYHSYLKITSVSVPVIVPAGGTCEVTLVADQFFYTQPPSGQFKGTFPNSASRTITLKLTPAPAPFPFSLTGGPFFQGRVSQGGVDKGSVTFAWVSPRFRRATVEMDTLAGAVAPAPVATGGGGTDFFDTIFARTGWELSVIRDQVNVPVPAGVTPTDCWSAGALHNLMTTVRNPGTNLDAEWRVHLMIVPAKLGCGRGVMYDTIGVPREGCASFCDDGYPTSDSSNFGAAANHKQRDVPRAYLRSATHEITHTFNQIHQEQETIPDNSIMTTTPSVADVLGGPTTGAPGVFPDQINLGHNATVRHHLNHMPDPVIRPGGWPFASWFPTGAPQAADRNTFADSELVLTITPAAERVPLGAPVEFTWTLTNQSGVDLIAPNDVSLEALFATITVIDGHGHEQPVRPAVIICERAKLTPLAPGQSVSARARVFWSAAGFAFERPGAYRVMVSVNWSAGGIPVGLDGTTEVFVDYPANEAENAGAALTMNPEVGKWVALGGDAYHLEEACRRLYRLSKLGGRAEVRRRDRTAGAAPAAGESRLVESFAGLLPNPKRVAEAHPRLMDEEDRR